MAVKFAVRGDSLTARYSNDGATAGTLGTSTQAAVTTDEPGINGVNSIDMVGSVAGVRQLIYNGRLNTPAGLNRSVLIRCKFASNAALGVFNMGTMTRNPSNYIGLSSTAGGELVFTIGTEVGATDSGTSSGASLSTTAFHDIGISWTGTTAAGGLIIAVDGSVVLTDTTTRDLPSPFSTAEQLAVSSIMIGGNFTSLNAHMSVDEVVVWDEIIDFTANVTLTSGAGLLNGASRTAYVDVEALDGAAATSGSGGINLGGIRV